MAFSFSRGIRRIQGIERFLGVERVLSPGQLGKEDYSAACALVWGRKQTGTRTRDWASKHSIPVWHLEDGFIRSCSSNAHSRMTYSLTVDDLGVYYDSTAPSLLENYLNDEASQPILETDRELSSYVRRCRLKLIEHNITKYNFVKDLPNEYPLFDTDQPIVLVVDQTFEDASVRFGSMSKRDFSDMLDAAIDENPGAKIIVKTHPDVEKGLKKGYLQALARKRSLPVLSEACNSISVIKRASAVYCGTSQMGFEALLCGKPVTVFGLPFYAGWGVTDDRKKIPRRAARRSVDELFYASYDWYSRYCNPVTGQRWTLEQCLDHVILQKQYFSENAKKFRLNGITPWKRGYIKQYLRSPEATFETDAASLSKDSTEVTWSYKTIPDENKSDGGDGRILRVEDGFLRGKGLGSDFTAPQSLVFDSGGLYFNPNKNSNLEDILNHRDCSLPEISRARQLISLIISRRLSKYNVGDKKHLAIFAAAPKKARKLLVIGQVENDASIQFGCSDISDNTALLKVVRESNKDAFVIYKPHPDVVAGNRDGKVSSATQAACIDGVCTDQDVIDCIDECDEVHTMTSLSGFEALIRGKKVVTYGTPFYAGWGLTRDRHKVYQRTRVRTLEELVFCALIEYPRYLDIGTGEFVSPEDLVVSVSDRREMKNNKITWMDRQVLKLKNVYKGLSYAP